MFKRISFEAWHEIVPVVAFVLTFGVFVYFVVRALRMKRERADYMANLPLREKGNHLTEKEETHE